MNESSNAKTMYEAVPAVAELNKVPDFDPLKFLRRTKDSMRLDLPYQKLWFRMAHPNGRMRMTALRITEQMAIFEARVFLDRSDAEPFSMSVAQQQLQDNRDFIRGAQNEALSQALTDAGFSDAVYDRLFEELQDLERQTDIQMANSPTSTVGYPAISKLEKTNHPIPLLSLDKEKNIVEVCRFMGEHQVMFMLKLDGLTIKLTYEGGELLEAATRGDGEVGEIVTHNTRAIGGIS